MKMYKVYYRLVGRLSVAYIEAEDETNARLNLLSRFYHVSFVKAVEYKWQVSGSMSKEGRK